MNCQECGGIVNNDPEGLTGTLLHAEGAYACECRDELLGLAMELAEALKQAAHEIVRLDPHIQHPDGTGYDCGQILAKARVAGLLKA